MENYLLDEEPYEVPQPSNKEEKENAKEEYEQHC